MSEKKGRLFVVAGLPASGKSTLARKILFGNTNAVRVNKDSLRLMLFGMARSSMVFDKSRERIVQATEDLVIMSMLAMGKDVVVDDTNLNPKRINKIKDMCSGVGLVPIFITMKASVGECIERDALREDPVGAAAIIEMAKRYNYDIGNLVKTKNEKICLPNKYIICDMDGTLADCSHRLHFVRKKDGNKPDWKMFFSSMIHDEPRQDVLTIARGYGLPIVVVSARPDDYRFHTEQWLSEHKIEYSGLIMRKCGDYRPDELVKMEMLDTYLDKDKIVAVIDDRPKVISAWRSRGLNVIDVGKGVDF